MPTNQKIRPAAVSGQFYPASSEELKKIINFYLEQAKTSPLPAARAIIVPHAGYAYSGGVAAYSFKALQGRKINTVILLGNSHTAYFDGVAVDDNDVWQTPLGKVEVDKKLAEKLVEENSFMKFNGRVHARDHVLEAQVPFLQMTLKEKFKILPLLFGNSHENDYVDLAQILAKVLDKDDFLVISSDFSHYPAYEDANEIDADTLELVRRGNVEDLEEHIFEVMSMNIPGEQTLVCSPDAVKTVMELSGELGWEAELLQYANSGDVPLGGKEEVVGYGAMVYKLKTNSERNDLSRKQQKIILNIARETAEEYVKTGKVKDFKVEDERLNRREGVFVTLRNQGELRGCIGLIVSPKAPLWQNVREMAIAAASQDSRFLPIDQDELPFIKYEISVLSAPEELDNWQKIELGRHGVIVSQGLRRGVFLPQVADETGWTREEFLSRLCEEKAGLPPDCYKDKKTKIEVFAAQVFSDEDVK